MTETGPAINYHLTEDKLKIREWSYTGLIAIVELIDPKSHESDSVCHAVIVSTSHSTMIMWFIGTGENHRRKGYATRLVEHLKGIFDEIVTQWNTAAGKALMLKCGFQTEDNKLVWKKEVVEDGSEKKETSEASDGAETQESKS